MSKEGRLTRRAQYQEVQTKGRSWYHDLLVLRVLHNELGWSRYGLAVGKRLGKAVVRNRVKRLLREAVRGTPAKPGWDVVLIARNQAARASFGQIKGALHELLRRSQLLDGATPDREGGR